MQNQILNDLDMPYCPGCGHTVANKSLNKTLADLSIQYLDIVVVSDIGCTGLVDPLLNCHTVHGLHGRAVALAMGIRMGLENQDKKIIALQGDGGATIGLQHILEWARQNLDLTLIIQNNMVYGMTGGQTSGLTSPNFSGKNGSTPTNPGYDICGLANNAGASFTARTFVGNKDQNIWEEAFSTTGFSLIEIVEMCPAYALRKVQELHDISDHESVVTRNKRQVFPKDRVEKKSLLSSIKPIRPVYKSPLKNRLEIIIAGSAGDAIQSAGDLLSTAGITAGLSATKKGDYPITIGTGFSVSEVILSRDPIYFTGINCPNVVFITSKDGLEKVLNRIGDETLVIADSKLNLNNFSNLHIAHIADFKKIGGVKGAALAAITFWLEKYKLLPTGALIEAAKRHKHSEKLELIINKAIAA